tara:strand:- start:818 stop:1222 length:405 start_codon:yes stop_codon:yes gene_type:complete
MNIDKLPDDILPIIFSYVNEKQKIFLNKTFYNKYYKHIDSLIKHYDSYIKDIVRNDCKFTFEYIIARNFLKWYTMFNYHYGNKIYNNYIDFLLEFSRKNKSNKCLTIINLHLEISKLKKLNCKDSRNINKKWIA